MQYDEMVEALRRRLGLDAAERAGTVLAATVQALSETAWHEAADLRSQLPGPLQGVRPAVAGTRRSRDEFIARVGELVEITDEDRARTYAWAGFSVIGAAITEGQLRQLLQDLPEDYATLAPSITDQAGETKTLLAEVRSAADLNTDDAAREVTEVVLTLLAEATSGGQAARLSENLPAEVGVLLHTDEPAAPTDVDRFLNEIVRRSSVTTAESARRHTSAVFTTLRHWAPGELADTVGQLPQPLSELASQQPSQL